MGLCKYKKKEFDEAIKYYDQVLNIKENHSNALYNKTLALLDKGETQQITELLLEAKNKVPMIFYACGLYYLKERKYDLAIEYFDACFEKNLRTPEILLSKAQALYEKENYEEANKIIDEAINAKSNIKYLNAYNTKGNILDKLGKKVEALANYKVAATESKPGNALFMINYCVSLLENKNIDKCKEMLREVESIYQSQRTLFNQQEYEYIEKCINLLHDKFDKSKKASESKIN